MLKQQLIALGFMWGMLVATAASAQTKSYEVRGEKVTLTVADDVILVRARVSEKALDLAARTMEAQSRLLGKAIEPAAVYFVKTPPRPVRQLDGLLVPRLPGLKDADLGRLAGMVPGVASCEPVYRAGQKLVMPTGTVTVRFNGPVQPRLLFALAEELGLKELARPKYAANVVRYQPVGPDKDPLALCEKLREKRFVRWAEPDMIIELLRCGTPRIPNDTFFQQQWYLQPGESGIQVPEAWGDSVGTDQIVVAVIDDGVDLYHPDLQPKLVTGYDFFERDPDPQPDAKSAHGTACSGIIGGMANNGAGIAGIAWNVRIMPIRVAGEEGFADAGGLAEAISFATQNGAKILSNSWGGGSPTNQLMDAIDMAVDAGCLVIFAAGNAIPAEHVFYPARYEQCLAVGSVRRDNTLWDYSCWGPGRVVDLVAPSGACNLEGDIWSTDQSGDRGYNSGGSTTEEPSGNYTAHFGGTSAATPVVAGVAALVWSTYPKLTAQQVRQVLEETATKVDPQNGEWVNGRSARYGFGMVNAQAALQRAKALVDGSSDAGVPVTPTSPGTPELPGLNPPAGTPSTPTTPTTPGRPDRSRYIK